MTEGVDDNPVPEAHRLYEPLTTALPEIKGLALSEFERAVLVSIPEGRDFFELIKSVILDVILEVDILAYIHERLMQIVHTKTGI